MLRKKFLPPPSLPPKPVSVAARERQPLPEPELTLLALRYHFALSRLGSGEGNLEQFVLLAQHVLIARSLGNIGCRRIDEGTLSAADGAIVTWTQHGLTTGDFQVDENAFAVLRDFLLQHDEQLQSASSAAVSVAFADLREEVERRRTVSPSPR